jgi:excisionase family DNA binding protein
MRLNKDHPKYEQFIAEANSPIPRKAYDMREAGKSIGVSWQTVYRQIRRGKLAVVQDCGRKLLILADEWDRFLNDNAKYAPRPGRGGPRVGRRKKQAAAQIKEVVE